MPILSLQVPRVSPSPSLCLGFSVSPGITTDEQLRPMPAKP